MAWAYIGPNETHTQDEANIAYRRLFSEPPEIVGVDVETVSIKNRTLLGVGFAIPNGDQFYFDIYDNALPWHLLFPSKTLKVWHNAVFDLSWDALGQYGVDIENIADSAILTRLLNIPTELTEAATFVGCHTDRAGDLLTEYKAKDMRGLPKEVTARKCMEDAWATLQLYLQKFIEVNQEYYKVEKDVLSLLIRMSHRGIKLDQDLVAGIDKELESELNIYKTIADSQGFNPLSPQQVAYMLSVDGIHLPFQRGKSQPTTDNTTLEKISNPKAALTLLARKYTRLHGVIHPWVGKDRAFSRFGMDASTGRISSSEDNLQNIPSGKRPGDIIPRAGRVRWAFLPDSDIITRFDMSQIELRVLAHLSGDTNMAYIMSLPKDQGGDLHLATQQAFGLYSKVIAKNVNFGMIYGGSDDILAEFTGITQKAELAGFRYKWQTTYPQAAAWIENQRQGALTNPIVETIYGRKLRIDNTKGKLITEKHLQNCAVNYPIQGTAAEIFKRVLVALVTVIKKDDYILQVHDEQLLNGWYTIPPELAHISPLWTPLEVRYLRRWE